MNIPYYFLSSLEKMACAYQSNVVDKEQSLFHHGIIKILVSYLLGELGYSWESFLPVMSLGKSTFTGDIPDNKFEQRTPFFL